MPGHLAINLESFFGLAAVALLLWRSEAGHAPTRPRLALDARDALPMVLIACMIGVAFWRASRISFLSDDYVLVSLAQDFTGNYRAMFTHGGGDGFFRPLGYLSLAWTSTWAGLDPDRWHRVALLLHLANSLLVYVLAGAIGLSRGSSWFASALFAWSGANPEAVVWIAGRFDLLAAFFGLIALVAFIKLWEESSWRWGMLALASLGAAMLSKESAYGIPLAMLVYVAGRRPAPPGRTRYLAPFFLLAAVMFGYRWMLQGGIGGYLDPRGRPQALSLHPVLMIEALGLRLWAVLFFPVNWEIPTGRWLGIATMLYAGVWVGLVYLVRGGQVRGGRERLLIPLGFALAAALPSVQQLLIGADLEKARLVYLPSAGFCLLVASVIGMAGSRLGWAAGVAILAFNLAALQHNLTGWETAAAKSRRVCEAVSSCSNPAPVEGLPRSLNGVYFFANGLPECVRIERAQRPDQPLHTCSLAWDPATGTLRAAP
jgi:hypothetical protein